MSRASSSVLGLVNRMLADARGRLHARLAGITDEEWFWEPVPNCWSVRPRSECTSEWANGTGDWVIDYGAEETPPPFTTVAWRVVHIASTVAGYLDMIEGWDWTSGKVPWNEYEIPSTAAEGLAFYDEQDDRLTAFRVSLTDSDLDQVVEIPFLGANGTIQDALRVLTGEAIHHGAEAGVLRDLYLRTGRQTLAPASRCHHIPRPP